MNKTYLKDADGCLDIKPSKLALMDLMQVLMVIMCACATLTAQTPIQAQPSIVPFGYGGQIKMLYDIRQRPQAVYLNDKLIISDVKTAHGNIHASQIPITTGTAAIWPRAPMTSCTPMLSRDKAIWIQAIPWTDMVGGMSKNGYPATKETPGTSAVGAFPSITFADLILQEGGKRKVAVCCNSFRLARLSHSFPCV
jgi:hypothetical protein